MTYAYAPQPARSTAPVSLHLVAVVQYLGGLLTLALATMLGLAAANLFPRLEYAVGADTYTNRPADITVVNAVIISLLAVIGLTAIVLGRKVQRGRNWARIALTGLNVLSAAGAACRRFARRCRRCAPRSWVGSPFQMVRPWSSRLPHLCRR